MTTKGGKNNLKNIKNNVDAGDFAKNGKIGGIASGKARRERRDMRNRIKEIFEMPIGEGEEIDFSNLSDAKGKNISVIDACILGQVQKAIGGDTRALEFLRDTAGMKPVEKQEITTEISSTGKLADILEELEK